jgi:hypothetical protein
MIEPTPEADLPEWMALAQHAVGSFCLLNPRALTRVFADHSRQTTVRPLPVLG